ncbi:acyltransferase [Solimonas sp. SE-A11]|uniref:acyltransferase family protein n=1 Tax=Solimonas sp. SE-A11 TaxID=3054954 RepID=UPI00259C9A32|nr:acyltransferase [Solimonas sp. SE-A11]MDM4769737.1 acyltransferase [Solimonas sp. SE-A11]
MTVRKIKMPKTDLHKPANLTGLTALRFFAALWVVLYHFLNQLSFSVEPYGYVLHKGYLAVDFFFILSGYIMAHVYGESIRCGAFDWWDYLRKRLARVYPMHVVTVLALVCLWGLFQLLGMKNWSPEKYDFSALPAHLLLIHSWGILETHAWNIPSWSISAEFAAYLLFPALFLAATRFRGLFGLALALLLLMACWVIALRISGYELTKFQLFGVPRILPEFFLGIVLRHLNWKVPGRLLIPLIVAVLLSAQFSPSDFPTVLLLAAIVCVGAQLSAPPWLVLLGDASYSLYMVHAIVQTVYFNALQVVGFRAENPWVSTTLMLGAVALSIIVSIWAYKHIEIPARDWLTRRRSNHVATHSSGRRP